MIEGDDHQAIRRSPLASTRKPSRQHAASLALDERVCAPDSAAATTVLRSG